MISFVMEYWKFATENKGSGGQRMEADESSYAFALGSVPWELGDRSQPISGTLLGVGRVIVTIEYTKQKISSSWNKGAFQGSTTHTNTVLEHQLPKEPPPPLDLLRVKVPSGSLPIWNSKRKTKE